MATFDRFDICNAHAVLEWDYNVGGWLRERPSNSRRMEATAVQLHRMQYKPSFDLCFDTLSENAKEIYLENVLRLKLPYDENLRAHIVALFAEEWLRAGYAHVLQQPHLH